MFHVFGTRTTFGAVAALAALGAGGTAYAATSSTGGPAPIEAPAAAVGASPSQAVSAGGQVDLAASTARRRARTLLARADHATVELKVKGQWVTYALDKGKVSAVSPTSISLARPDGQSVTEAISPTTRFRGVASEAAVEVGRPALVISQGGGALSVRQKPAPAAPAG